MVNLMLRGKEKSVSQCQEPERTGLSVVKRRLTLEEVDEELRRHKLRKLSSSEAANKPSLECPLLPSLYLQLHKEPIWDQIQRTLSKDNKNYPSSGEILELLIKKDDKNSASSSENLELLNKKKGKAKVGTSSPSELLKASIFPATSLRIGEWEFVSQCEGDLVAKFYFGRHKIVWEVICGGSKNIIEIKWADIVGLKANCPENGLGSLTIVLGKRPLFFRQTNPQPEKHDLWQPTSDFTNGNASRYRKHHLQFACCVLNKHYEKLIQCDTRLNVLSQQSDTHLDLHFVKTSIKPSFMPSTSHSRFLNTKEAGFVDLVCGDLTKQTQLPNSEVSTHGFEEYGVRRSFGPKTIEQRESVGIQQTISISDFPIFLLSRM